MGLLVQPEDRSGSDWLSDIVPHLAYGAVTGAILESSRR
jgi:hypothetical protein